VADVIDVLVLLYLYAFEVSEVLVVQVVLDSGVIAVAQLHAA
jgi:hypothetical protein